MRRGRSSQPASTHVASPRAVGFLRRLLMTGEWHDVALVMEVAKRGQIELADLHAALAELNVDMRPVDGGLWEIKLPPQPPEPTYTYRRPLTTKLHRRNYYPR